MLKRAEKALVKLDRQDQAKLVKYLDNLRKLNEPYEKAKALTGELVGMWRFRVGDYRIICQIDNKTITILVLEIGHRKDIYK